jgi:hypothetical protein
MRVGIVAAPLFALAACQSQQPRVKVAPEFELPGAPGIETYAIGPEILRDEGCAKDFVKARSVEGVERGKMEADLAAFCTVRLPTIVYHASVLETKTFGRGAYSFEMLHVSLAPDPKFPMPTFASLPPGDSPTAVFRRTQVYDGWAPRSELRNAYGIEEFLTGLKADLENSQAEVRAQVKARNRAKRPHQQSGDFADGFPSYR